MQIEVIYQKIDEVENSELRQMIHAFFDDILLKFPDTDVTEHNERTKRNDLKRMKDVDGGIIDPIQIEGGPYNDQYTLYKEVFSLKKEAIKWIKALKNENNWERKGNVCEFKPFKKEGLDLSRGKYERDDGKGVIDFIRFFFGITDKELK